MEHLRWSIHHRLSAIASETVGESNFSSTLGTLSAAADLVHFSSLLTNEQPASHLINPYYKPSTSCFLCVFFKTVGCNLFILNMLWAFFQKGTFGLLFFAVVRFSPPSQETEAVKRKAEAKNIRRLSIATINRLFMLTLPAHLQLNHGKSLDPTNRDVLRAQIIRSALNQDTPQKS